MSQSLLELLLEGRDDPFKARVWEIVQRYHLDTDDPNFQILIATGQLEVLLEIAPAQLEADMTKLVDNCQKMIQAEVRCFQESISQKQLQLDQAIQLAQALVKQNQDTIVAAQTPALESVKAFLEEQRKTQEAQSAASIDVYKAALTKDSQAIITNCLQRNWWVQVTWPGAIAAMVLASIGLIAGWHVKSAQVYQHYSPAELEYLGKLWQKNSDTLLQCQQDAKPNCEIKLR
jgi:hypothetical protein